MFAGDLADERRGAGFFVLFAERRRAVRDGGGAGRTFFFFFRRGRWQLAGAAFGWRGRRPWLGSGGFAIDGDGSDDGVHADRGAFGDFDFLQNSGGGGGNFGVDLVGGDLEQRFVALDFVAGLLQPLGDSALNDGFAHLGHDDVSWHDFLPCEAHGSEKGSGANEYYSGWRELTRAAGHARQSFCTGAEVNERGSRT